MHRSSETIGAIATALAKAQGELKNPEKSLVATIASPFPREGSRTFRYASLASGLEIVRKCLSQHEIATVQTAAIDAQAGLLRLTTVLAHSSGEWMSSDWPVCAISETVAPHRMGAALTYARRYALFTLVGIAGEDDLDVTGLHTREAGAAHESNGGDPASPLSCGPANGPGSGLSPLSSRAAISRRVRRLPRAALPEEESAALRKELVAQAVRLSSADEAARWALESLPRKNTLTDGDARFVEASFARTVAKLSDDPGRPDTEPSGGCTTPSAQANGHKSRSREVRRTVRLRDKEHRMFVARQPCLVCARVPSDAHHLRFAQPRALACKTSDEYTVPLCRTHHRQLHRNGQETEWWVEHKIDPMPIAQRLWDQTRAGGSPRQRAEDEPGPP